MHLGLEKYLGGRAASRQVPWPTSENFQCGPSAVQVASAETGQLIADKISLKFWKSFTSYLKFLQLTETTRSLTTSSPQRKWICSLMLTEAKKPRVGEAGRDHSGSYGPTSLLK